MIGRGAWLGCGFALWSGGLAGFLGGRYWGGVVPSPGKLMFDVGRKAEQILNSRTDPKAKARESHRVMAKESEQTFPTSGEPA